MIQLTLTLKMDTTQVVKMSVTVNNSPIQAHWMIVDFCLLYNVNEVWIHTL